MTVERIDGHRLLEFGDGAEMRDRLLDFVFNGNKRATAGMLEYDYDEDEPVESVGEIFILVGNENQPVGKIQITRVDVVQFDEVSDEFALAEAEGDLSGDDFRRSHRAFWEGCGHEVKPESMVVCAYFELLEKY
ncbi:MAG: ASCH domain-containing protein [Rhodoluna sp.]|nr:ASCH domain-containing protein [Rhodoluna sp.]